MRCNPITTTNKKEAWKYIYEDIALDGDVLSRVQRARALGWALKGIRPNSRTVLLFKDGVFMTPEGFAAITFRNPADIPAKYIIDPSLPLPKGMSRRQSRRVAELREAYQWAMTKRIGRKRLLTPEVVAEYLIPILAPLHVEHMVVLPLDPRGELIEAPHPVSRGDVDATDAGPRMVLRAVLAAGATSFIIAHNHPTGNPEPSAADRAVTRRLADGGRAIDIPLRDHLVIAPPAEWRSLIREDPSLFR